MASPRLFWKIFSIYASLNLILVVGCLIVVYAWQRPFALEQAKNSLIDTAWVIAADIERQMTSGVPNDELKRSARKMAVATKTRITVIAPSGIVLVDSDEVPRPFDKHLDRPEIQQVQGGSEVGSAIRRSNTTGLNMLYVAKRLNQGQQTIGYARVAKAVDAIDTQVSRVVGIMIVMMFGIGLIATIITFSMVRRLMRPLANLTRVVKSIMSATPDDKDHSDYGDELGTLGAAFAQLHRELSERMTQLKENNERLANVMDNMAEGVITVGSDEKIILANDAGRKMLDIAINDVEGRPLWEVTRSRVLHEAFAESLENDDDIAKEFEVGGLFRRTLTLRATRLTGEPNPGVMLVLHDVTELRRLENLRRDFVANVGHELKTPLSSIKAYAETLKMGAINDQENNLMFVERIEEQAERLHQLILDLLQIARMESGQCVFDITNVSLPAMVAACVKQHADTAAAKKIDLVAAPSSEVVYVRADEEGVRTILNNLVDNAVKYTPNGGQVTIGWHVEGENVKLEVQDTGIGIAQQHHGRVFERFYRVDKARSRELGGTGLGLSIVKHLAQSFGGGVAIESQLHKGSTFRVRLPRAA